MKLVLLWLGMSQLLDPSPPLFPTDYRECNGLAEAWNERIKYLNQKSKEITDAVSRACPVEKGNVNRCYANHGCNFWSPMTENTDLGQLVFDCKSQRSIEYDIKKAYATLSAQRETCSARVRQHHDKEKAAKEKAEKEKAERERAEATRRARASSSPTREVESKPTASRSSSSKPEPARPKDDRPTPRPDTSQRERERENAARDRFEQRMAESAQRIQEAREAGLRHRTAERQDQLAAAEQRAGAANSLFGQVVDDAKERVRSAAAELTQLAGLLSPPGSRVGGEPGANSADPLAGFDLAGPSARQQVTESWKVAEQVRRQLNLAPFAGIPFAILKNTQLATADAMDGLASVITRFDTASAADADAILGRWERQVFSPEAYVGITRDWLAGQAKRQVSRAVRDAVRDVAPSAAPVVNTARQAYRAWMFAQPIVRPMASAPPPVRFHYEAQDWEFQATADTPWRETDAAGAAVFYDRNGRPHAARQEAAGLVPGIDPLALRARRKVRYSPMAEPSREQALPELLDRWFLQSLLEKR